MACSLVKKIDQAIRNFTWTGRSDKKKLVAPSSANMCRSIEEGGLGLRSLKSMNRAALMKTTWSLLTDNSTLCAFVRGKLRLSSSGSHLKKVRSSLLVGCRAALSIILEYAIWWVGSGTKIDFWHDYWLGGALFDLLNIQLSLIGKLKARVADFLIQGQWCLPPAFQLSFSQISQQIGNVEPYAKGDTLLWSLFSNDILSFKDAYDACRSR